MSKAVSAVGKVFKKAASSVIGKIVIAVAVAWLTAGIGTTLLGAMGASTSFLGSTLGTMASYGLHGAIAGGLTSALTGGDIAKGALMGGAGGMVFGGVSSAMGGSTPAGWGEQGFGKMVTGGSEVAEGASKVGAAGNEGLIGGGGSETVGGGAAGDTLNASAVTEAPINGAIGPEATPGLNADLSGLQPSQATGSAAGPWTNPQTANPGFVGHSVNATPSVMGAPMPAGATGAYVPDGSSGGLFGNGGWIERNGDLAGKVGGGIAQGAMGMLKGDGADYTDVYNRRLDQDQNQWLAGRQAHDQASGGLLTARPATTRPDGYYPTPNQRFASNQYGAGQWVYDSQQGRVVFVANAAPATATA